MFKFIRFSLCQWPIWKRTADRTVATGLAALLFAGGSNFQSQGGDSLDGGSSAKPIEVAATAVPSGVPSTKWVSGYYPGWGHSKYPPSAIDFNSLTHVMVFSVLPLSGGTLNTTMFAGSLGPSMAQSVAKLAHAAGKKALLTVGGADTSTGFESSTSSANIATFVQNLVNLVNSWGFDGIDLDWEPLSSADYPAFASLVSSLKAAKPEMLITMTAGYYSINFPMGSTEKQFFLQMSSQVDQLNVMTYNMSWPHPGWVSWHNSPIYGEGSNHPVSVTSSVAMYTAAGIPASKLGFGIGFYGACWTSPVTAPLQAPGASTIACEDQSMGYANIMNHYYPSSHYFYDSAAQSPYLSSSSPVLRCGCTLISYEDETSVAAKGAYAQQAGLGGVIIWEMSEGYNTQAADDPSSMLHAVGKAFGVQSFDRPLR
jgi:chitinase